MPPPPPLQAPVAQPAMPPVPMAPPPPPYVPPPAQGPPAGGRTGGWIVFLVFAAVIVVVGAGAFEAGRITSTSSSTAGNGAQAPTLYPVHLTYPKLAFHYNGSSLPGYLDVSSVGCILVTLPSGLGAPLLPDCAPFSDGEFALNDSQQFWIEIGLLNCGSPTCSGVPPVAHNVTGLTELGGGNWFNDPLLSISPTLPEKVPPFSTQLGETTLILAFTTSTGSYSGIGPSILLWVS